MKRFIVALVLAFSFAAFASPEPGAVDEKDKAAEMKSGKKEHKKGEKKAEKDAEKKADAPKTEAK